MFRELKEKFLLSSCSLAMTERGKVNLRMLRLARLLLTFDIGVIESFSVGFSGSIAGAFGNGDLTALASVHHRDHGYGHAMSEREGTGRRARLSGVVIVEERGGRTQW